MSELGDKIRALQLGLPVGGTAHTALDRAAALADEHEAELVAELEAGLQDPVAVHINMLRGGIAKPSWANIMHLYPTDVQATVAAAYEAAAQRAERHLNDWASDLDGTRNDLISAQTAGEWNGRKVRDPAWLKAEARHFGERAEAVAESASHTAAAIRAMTDADAAAALARIKAEAVREALSDFTKADWFWRDLDPDDSGDTPDEAINAGMMGRFAVCHIRSSFTGPDRFCFIAPVLDPESDDEECLCFETEDEAIAAARERSAILKAAGEAGE